MRKFTFIAAAVMSIMAGAAVAQTGGAAAVKSEPGKVTVAETAQLTASVEAVDKAKRLITLKGPEGNTFVFQAGPAVKNFDQIKVGDLVVARYIEALTLELKPGGGQVRERTEREKLFPPSRASRRASLPAGRSRSLRMSCRSTRRSRR